MRWLRGAQPSPGRAPVIARPDVNGPAPLAWRAMSIAVHAAPIRAIDPLILYALLKLRVDVFVVEQDCVYPELDGRDVEPDAVQFWATDGDDVVGTLRLLDDGAEARIGRVATAPSARSAGVARLLMQAAIDAAAGRVIVLDAQAPLEGWYARFGFDRDGADFVEDGIPHVPMRRALPTHPTPEENQ